MRVMFFKRGICIVLIAFWLPFFALAQQNYDKSIPELETELVKSSGLDRIKILHDLTLKVRYQNVKQALEYGEEAYDLSKAIGEDSLEAQSQLYLGYVLILSRDKIGAIDNLIEARAIFNRLGILSKEMHAIQTLAAQYSELGEYEEASELYFIALDYARKLNSKEAEVYALTSLGTVQRSLNEYRIAQRFFNDAIQLSVENGDWSGQSMALAEAGYLEEKAGNTEKAIEYYQRTIDLFNEKNIRHAIPALMFDIARLYKDDKKLNEALVSAKKAVALSDSLNNKLLALNNLDELAQIHQELGNSDEAISILKDGITQSQESGLLNTELFLLNKLAYIYSESGRNQDALITAKRAKEIALTSNDWNGAQSALEVLSETTIKMGNFSEAVEFQKELMAVRDSIINEERTKSILEFEARYRISEKEKEIELLQSENKRKAMVQLFLGLGFILVLISGFFIVRSQMLKIKNSKSELELSKLKRKELQKDLEFKNKQLTTQSLNMVQKNEMMEEMKEKVENLKKEGSSRELNSLVQLVDYSFNLDEDWKQFQMHFEEVHSGFYHVLKDRYPDLTPNEMRLSALVKLNLTIKEMAAILGISPDSVKTARYRLRKKLEINTEDNLTNFMLQLEKESLEA